MKPVLLGILVLIASTACERPPVASDDATPPPAAIAPAPDRWRAILRDIDDEFPDVARTTTADVAATGPGDFVLVDVRPEAEYAVSHIPGALHAPLGADLANALAGVPHDSRIVVYCSVGWRSAIAARELSEAGFTRVENLEGSIFAWANEGRPLEDDRGATDRVHPYDDNWGQLLRADLRAR